MDSYFILIRPFIEICSIATVLYCILSFFWNTRTMDLIFGFLAFFFIFIMTKQLNFIVLEELMGHIVRVVVLAILIIFQPELRIAIAKLSIINKGRRQQIHDFDQFLEDLAESTYKLAEKGQGALILLENQDLLDEYANKAVLLHAEFSSELLESIFVPGTPLHDGAVIIRGRTLISAATILPLAEESQGQLRKSMGTRHRAGLGISQLTDVVIILVSEETGKVSIAREGIMTQGIGIDKFKAIIRSIFRPEEAASSFLPLNWFRG